MTLLSARWVVRFQGWFSDKKKISTLDELEYNSVFPRHKYCNSRHYYFSQSMVGSEGSNFTYQYDERIIRIFEYSILHIPDHNSRCLAIGRPGHIQGLYIYIGCRYLHSKNHNKRLIFPSETPVDPHAIYFLTLFYIYLQLYPKAFGWLNVRCPNHVLGMIGCTSHIQGVIEYNNYQHITQSVKSDTASDQKKWNCRIFW